MRLPDRLLHLGAEEAEVADTFEAELDLSDRNVPLVQGGFDLSIRIGRPADSSLRAQLLGRVSVVLVASPKYLARCGVPKQPRELAEHDCISVGPIGGASTWTMYRGLERENIAIDGVVQTTSPSLGAQLAASGQGILRTTEWVVRDELNAGALVPVMPRWSCDHPTHGGVPVYVMYAQAATTVPPLKSRVFVELVKNIVAAEIG